MGHSPKKLESKIHFSPFSNANRFQEQGSNFKVSTLSHFLYPCLSSHTTRWRWRPLSGVGDLKSQQHVADSLYKSMGHSPKKLESKIHFCPFSNAHRFQEQGSNFKVSTLSHFLYPCLSSHTTWWRWRPLSGGGDLKSQQHVADSLYKSMGHSPKKLESKIHFCPFSNAHRFQEQGSNFKVSTLSHFLYPCSSSHTTWWRWRPLSGGGDLKSQQHVADSLYKSMGHSPKKLESKIHFCPFSNAHRFQEQGSNFKVSTLSHFLYPCSSSHTTWWRWRPLSGGGDLKSQQHVADSLYKSMGHSPKKLESKIHFCPFSNAHRFQEQGSNFKVSTLSHFLYPCLSSHTTWWRWRHHCWRAANAQLTKKFFGFKTPDCSRWLLKSVFSYHHLVVKHGFHDVQNVISRKSWHFCLKNCNTADQMRWWKDHNESGMPPRSYTPYKMMYSHTVFPIVAIVPNSSYHKKLSGISRYILLAVPFLTKFLTICPTIRIRHTARIYQYGNFAWNYMGT